jgi:hypothetical protein
MKRCIRVNIRQRCFFYPPATDRIDIPDVSFQFTALHIQILHVLQKLSLQLGVSEHSHWRLPPRKADNREQLTSHRGSFEILNEMRRQTPHYRTPECKTERNSIFRRHKWARMENVSNAQDEPEGGNSWEDRSEGIAYVEMHYTENFPGSTDRYFDSSAPGFFHSDNRCAHWRRLKGGMPWPTLNFTVICTNGRFSPARGRG